MSLNSPLLWLCLFLFGTAICGFSLRDLWRRKANVFQSLQLPWTMASLALTVGCLLNAVRPLRSQVEARHEMVFAVVVLASLWWGMIARRPGLRRANPRRSKGEV